MALVRTKAPAAKSATLVMGRLPLMPTPVLGSFLERAYYQLGQMGTGILTASVPWLIAHGTEAAIYAAKTARARMVFGPSHDRKEKAPRWWRGFKSEWVREVRAEEGGRAGRV